jgi:hypothetical protein
MTIIPVVRSAPGLSFTAMADTAERQTPFDERAALEELERLRRSIEHYRKQRQAVVDEFDEFVGSFPKPADMQLVPMERPRPEPPAPPPSVSVSAPTPPVPVSAPTPPVPVSAPTAPVSAPTSSVAITAPPSPLPVPAQTPSLEPETAPEPTMDALTARLRGIPSDVWATPASRLIDAEEIVSKPAEPPAPPRRSRVVALAVLVAVLGGLIAWSFLSRRAGPSQPVHTAATPAAPAAVPPAVAPSPVPAPVAPEEGAAAVVLTTRAVWLRVTVDGERVLERQLPADTRIPLKPQSTIVIRTGDAGAVTLSIDGKDQGPLGKNGEVVTRTFTISTKAPR